MQELVGHCGLALTKLAIHWLFAARGRMVDILQVAAPVLLLVPGAPVAYDD